jgi:putative nucleotidyltransferase with HDIG domain
MKSRVLFVDDEVMVLQGLRRMLRGLADEWDMRFVEGGAQALEALAAAPFDVVVTDMRMPEMNGAELLEHVRALHPRMVRLILSGQSSEETMLASVGPAHQFLAKPCDADRLKETIRRACALRVMLDNPTLQRLLSRLGSLPSAPDLYLQLVSELRSPNASIHRAAAIIATDPSMTAKLLQLVNSAFFGIQQHVTDPQRAASILGLNTIVALVLSVKVFSEYDAAVVRAMGLSGLMHHSLRVGSYARTIARVAGATRQEEDDAYTAGLLHDVGRVILATSLSSQYRTAIDRVARDRVTMFEAEQDVFGASHAEVGAYLLGLWGLPDSIVEAVAHHHRPDAAVARTVSPLVFVHVANCLVQELDRTGDRQGAPTAIDVGYLARIGQQQNLPRWKEACAEDDPDEAGDGERDPG